MPDDAQPKSFMQRFSSGVYSIVDGPVTAFREKIVEPIQNKNKSYYYHRRFRRVPTIDECEEGEPLCFFEANEQFKRDKMVDTEVLNILRQRRMECEHFYGTDAPKHCGKVTDDYEDSVTNWFVKYGDLGAAGHVRQAYMKQKHRMIWERRHGPVGTGMRDPHVEKPDDE